MSKRKGMSFDEKKVTLLAAMQGEASFFTLKELETLGKSKGVIPQAVKDVVESLVADDEVQSDKVGSQLLFWALPSQRTATLQNKRQKLEAETKHLQAELQKLQGARLRSKPVWTPSSLRYEGLETSDESFVFAKPPYLFAEPQKSQLFQLKQSLLLDDDSIVEASPPSLGCTELEHELLVGEEQRPSPERPEMPARLRRQDMAPRSRARYTPGYLHDARNDGLHRVKRAHHLHDVKFSIGSLTYFSVETCQEWQMPRRSEYRSPKSRRPLEGFGGRVKPGVYRQPEAKPAAKPASAGSETTSLKLQPEIDIATTSPGSPCTPFRYACFCEP